MSKLKKPIPHRSRKCTMHAEEFLPGTAYFSLLERDFQEGYLRFDYCVSCWEKIKEKGLEGKVYWSATTLQKSGGWDPKMQRDEKALQLFLEYQDQEDKKNELYILSLLLQRAKLLIFRQDLIEEGRVYQLLEVASSEQMIPVEKVALSGDETARVQQLLAEAIR